MGPSLYVERSRAAQGELSAAKVVLEAHHASPDFTLGEDQLCDLLFRVGGVIRRFQDADPAERRGFYQELGLCTSVWREGQGDSLASRGLFACRRTDWKLCCTPRLRG